MSDHEFYPGDHAFIDEDHLCHDCGRTMGEHVDFGPEKMSPTELVIRALIEERDKLRERLTETKAEYEAQAQVADRLRAALEKIATDYYHDRHAIWAREALDNETAP